MQAKERLIIAVDTSDVNRAYEIVGTLSPHVGGFKIGLEFISSTYAQMVAKCDFVMLEKLHQIFEMAQKGFTFWDGKWDDIPNTVGGAAKGIQPLNPKYVDVHTSAGFEAVVNAVKNSPNSTVLGITVLTSIDEEECILIFGDPRNGAVLKFAQMLVKAEAGGIVCSGQELIYLKENLGKQFYLLEKIIPGIRPLWAPPNDQKAFMTPTDALKNGADRIVVGRPITNPPKEIGGMVNAAKLFVEEIEKIKK